MVCFPWTQFVLQLLNLWNRCIVTLMCVSADIGQYQALGSFIQQPFIPLFPQCLPFLWIGNQFQEDASEQNIPFILHMGKSLRHNITSLMRPWDLWKWGMELLHIKCSWCHLYVISSCLSMAKHDGVGPKLLPSSLPLEYLMPYYDFLNSNLTKFWEWKINSAVWGS